MKTYLLLLSCVFVFTRCDSTVAENEKTEPDTDEVIAAGILEDFQKELSENDYKEAMALKHNLIGYYYYTDAKQKAVRLWNDYLKDNPEAAEQIKESERLKELKVEVAKDRAVLERLDSLLRDGFPKHEGVTEELEQFDKWHDEISGAYYTTDTTNKALAEELVNKLKAQKRKRFPILRKRFAEETGKLLWRENIEVVISGEGDDVLTLIGGMFADNASTEDFHKTLSKKLGKLEFKRVNYKWYKYDDDYTSYGAR